MYVHPMDLVRIDFDIMRQKVITMTGWRRPEYTKKVIDNLKRCIGIEGYTILPTIEPGYPAVLDVFNNLPNCNVVINDTRLGCGANTLKALQRGFDISDFVIHIEDDTVPGIDSLKYLEWANKTYENNNEIFTVTTYNRIRDIDEINPQNYFTSYRQKWYTGWMWGTWKNRFEEMSKKWNFASWDVNINKKIRGNRYEICPTIPRSQNIGEYLGTHVRPGYWRKYHYSPIWINNIFDPSNTPISSDFSNIISNNLDLIYTEVAEPTNNLVLLEEKQLEKETLILLGILTGSTYLFFG